MNHHPIIQHDCKDYVAEEGEESEDMIPVSDDEDPTSPTVRLGDADWKAEQMEPEPSPCKAKSIKKDSPDDLRASYWAFIHEQQKEIKKEFPEMGAKEALKEARDRMLNCIKNASRSSPSMLHNHDDTTGANSQI